LDQLVSVLSILLLPESQLKKIKMHATETARGIAYGFEDQSEKFIATLSSIMV